MLDVDGQAARDTAAAISAAGGRAEPSRVTSPMPRSVNATFDQIVARAGRLDILVNNAGVAHVGNIERTPEDDFDRLYRVNVKGVYLCSQAAVPVMVRQGGGVILNMASIVSFIGVADRFAYSMTKGAVLTMTKSVAVDYVKQNVRCNCICPARIRTPFVDGFVDEELPGPRAGGAAGACRSTSRWAAWAHPRRSRISRCISAPMRRRSSRAGVSIRWRSAQPMTRHVLTMNLKDDPQIVQTYRRYHRDVWPEVQQSLRRFGVTRMDIHLLGRRLVMFVEMRDGVDYRDAFKRMQLPVRASPNGSAS